MTLDKNEGFMKNILILVLLMSSFQAKASTIDLAINSATDPNLIRDALILAIQNSQLDCSWLPHDVLYPSNEEAKNSMIRVLRNEGGTSYVKVNRKLAQPLITVEFKWDGESNKNTTFEITTTSDFKNLTHIKADVYKNEMVSVNNGTILDPIFVIAEKRVTQYSSECSVR
jgi:hypothetical protein